MKRAHGWKGAAFAGGWLLAGLLFPRLLAPASELVERFYGAAMFPALARVFALPARIAPISLAQALLASVLATVVIWFVRETRSALRQSPMRLDPRVIERALAVCAVAVWAFHLSWGLNYVRPPLRERLALPITQDDPEHLARVLRRLASDTNARYEEAIRASALQADVGIAIANSRATPPASKLAAPRRDVALAIDQAYARILPQTAGVGFAPPKYPRLLGRLLSWFGISGIYIPFTYEATVNVYLPHASLPFTMAHEMAHQRGVAPEDEANFLAWLACVTSDEPATRYSGSLAAYGSCLRAFARVEPDSAVVWSRRLLSPGPLADRASIRAFWERHEGRASDLATRVNDSYLKANAQRAGVESYGRMVELLLAWDADGRWPAGNSP